MTISSRTPEGDPNQCPICGHHVRLEPSIDTRDSPCPSCGHLLWFAQDPSGGGIERADRQPIRVRATKQMMMEAAIKRFGIPPENARTAFEHLGSSKFDKVDWVEFLRAQSWTDVVYLMKAGAR
jgi:DNA-directed RNA polymerase subunit RPC12/RpoP